MSENNSVLDIDGARPNRILIEVISRYDWLFEKLVDLNERNASACHYIIVSSDSLKKKYLSLLRQKDSVVITLDEIDAELAKVQFGDHYNIIETAHEFEIFFGYRYLRDIMQQDRGVWAARVPFAAPTWGSAEVLDDNLVFDRINRGFKFLDFIFANFKPQMIIARPGSVITNIAISIAERKGVPCTMPRPARHKSFVTWTLGPYSHSAQLKAFFDTDCAGSNIEVDDIQPPEGSRQVFANFQNAYSFKGLLRRFLIETYNHAFILGKAISRGKIRSRARYSIFFKRFVLECKTIQFLKKIWVDDLDAIPGKKLLFLLPKEPEYTVQSLGRDFNNIHAILAHLSVSLPVDTTLLVKEHSRLGFRKLGFYDELTRYSNIRFANPLLPSKHFLKDCDAAATLAGTIALECCAEGKKCLTFTNRMEYNFLPNVVYASNLYNLCDSVSTALKKPEATELEFFKQAASTYYSVLERTSFDARGTKVFEGASEISDEELLRAWRLLCLNYQFQLNNEGKFDDRYEKV